MSVDYSDRLLAAQAGMRLQGLDWLAVSASADLAYLSGVRAEPGDRLTALLLPADGPAKLLVPALEAAALDRAALPIGLVAWPDGTDPVALMLETIGGDVGAIGVAESFWARDLLRLIDGLPGVSMSLATSVLRPLRLIKDATEIESMRRAAHAADRVFERVIETGLLGRTEGEVAESLRALLVEEGHDAPAFNIVAAGPHAASPHHVPGRHRIARGEMVVLDFGGLVDGYYSDITRTVAIGEPDDEQRAVYEAVRTAQDAGVRAVRPGATASSIDALTRAHLVESGFGAYVVHRTGHGLGLDVHEPPYIVEGDDVELRRGMVFSIEPGLYLPGRFGVRIEDIVVVTDDGVERLNRADRALRSVD